MTRDENELADAKRDALECGECSGTGFKDRGGARLAIHRSTCSACGGAGYPDALQATPFAYCAGCDGYNCSPEKGCAYPGAAALPGAVQPVAVAVKELEWGQTSYGTPEAHSVVGVYRINNAWNGGWTVVIGREVLRDVSGRENFADVDAAKAAAQAHFETRIRSSLIPATMAGDGDVVEAGQFLLDRLEQFVHSIEGDWPFVEFNGHVEPAMARFRAALANPRLREEPK